MKPSPPQPDSLIGTARRLARPSGRGRPKQTDLRRAVSTAYYALFHLLAEACADFAIGRKDRRNIRRAWAQVYRSLDHGRVRNLCDPDRQNSRIKRAVRKFPEDIQAVDGWRAGIRARAERPKVWCALSGITACCGPDQGAEPAVACCAHTVLEAFGPNRILRGSDRPVVSPGAGRMWASGRAFSGPVRTPPRDGPAVTAGHIAPPLH